MAEAVDGLPGAVGVGEVHVGEAYSDLSFEPDRLSPEFLREFEFAESVDGCHGVDGCRELAGHAGDRPLDLAYQLEEGGHGSEGDGSCSDARHAP